MFADNKDSDKSQEQEGGFEVFRERALNPKSIDKNWLVGFDPKVRDGFENAIVESIISKIVGLHEEDLEAENFLFDIGAGSSALTEMLTEALAAIEIKHVAIDSKEMLDHLNLNPNRIKMTGKFPDNLSSLQKITTKPRVILVYSVLQYVVNDGLLDSFLKACFDLLTPGALLILGDLPNFDMRNRKRIASNLEPENGLARPIGDQIVQEIMKKAHEFGMNCFLVYQPRALKLSHHRHDLIVQLPTAYRTQ